jgi:hypothetical protein
MKLIKHLDKSIITVDNVTGVVARQTFTCLEGGSVVQTSDWKDEFTITANDSVQLQYTDCYEFQVTANGSLSFTYTQVSDFISFDDFSVLGLNISFDNYSLKVDGSSVAPAIVGEYTLLINKNNFTQTVDITAEQLTISIPEYQQTIEDLVIEKIYTENTNIETLNVSSTLIDSYLEGSVSLVTLQNFEFDSQESLTPFSGSMKITGENNSSIVLTVINSSLVQLDTDFDGNNTIDNTDIVTWNDLGL